MQPQRIVNQHQPIIVQNQSASESSNTTRKLIIGLRVDGHNSDGRHEQTSPKAVVKAQDNESCLADGPPSEVRSPSASCSNCETFWFSPRVSTVREISQQQRCKTNPTSNFRKPQQHLKRIMLKKSTSKPQLKSNRHLLDPAYSTKQ